MVSLSLKRSRFGMFPSPCGVNIVGNLVDLGYSILEQYDEFPSPCGVNIVGNDVLILNQVRSYNVLVSVPLRGKYCREFLKLHCYPLVFKGFRPLAG